MRIFSTLRVKIAATAVLLVSVTVIGLLTYMTELTNNVFIKSSEVNAFNILNATINNVENQYRSINFYRENILANRKRNLRDIINIAFSSLNSNYDLYRRGLLSESEAKKHSMNELKKIRYNNFTGYIWINDTGKPYPRMIMHPTIPELDGKVLDSPEYNTAFGRNENLFKAFVDTAERNGEGYVDYLWPKPAPGGLIPNQPKLSYVRLFKPWNWVVGTGIYTDDVKKEAQKRIDAVIKDLGETLPNMTKHTSDSITIFNGKHDVIVHPTYSGKKNFKITNPETGNNILDDLIAASKTPDKKIRYTWSKPGDEKNLKYSKIAFVKYFKPLDWYVVSSFYLDETTAASRLIRSRLFAFSIVFLLLALFLSFVMASYLTRPLNRIMKVLEKGAKGELDTKITINRNDEFGQLAEYFNTFVTEISSYKKKLEKETSFSSEIINMSPSFITLIDTKGKLKMANKTMLEACGYTSNDVIDKDYIPIFINDRDKERVAGVFASILKGEKQPPVINSIIARDKTKYTVEWRNATIFDDEGNIEYILGVGLDISDRVKAEEHLLQAQKMETVGVLAGGLAHDFNNILGGIVGTISIMKYKMEKKGSITPEKMQEYLSILEQSGTRATDMIKQLLTLSRKQNLALKMFDLNTAVNSILEIIKNSFDKSITIKCTCIDTPAIINGDQAQIEQVILNLCINAAHSMTIMKKEEEPWGGTLSIALKEFKPDYLFVQNHPGSSHVPYWMLSVSDTGVGIPEELKVKIFTPFFTTKRKGQGTGLGLSMVYSIIKQHDGFVDIYSEEKIGSEFRIYIPRVDANMHPEIDKEDESEPVTANGETILVIDDEEVIRENARTILTECGYNIILARNGKEGIHIFRSRALEISGILIDMAMPEMSGKETYRKLKEIDPGVKVLLSSGYRNDERIEDSLSLGAAGFIQKPYTMMELSRAISNILK